MCKRGFTLIELLVVIGVIGLLVAIELPKINMARNNAREAQVKSNLNTIQKAIERYATDNGALYPPWLYGGDLSDSFTSTEATFNRITKSGKGLKVDKIAIKKPFSWMKPNFALPGDGDSLLEYGYLFQYPKNPFVTKSIIDNNSKSNLTFNHKSQSVVSIRNIAGINNNRMWEISGGPPQRGIRNHIGNQFLQPVEYVDPTRNMAPMPKNPKIFTHLTGNFYYYSLLQNVDSWGQYNGQANDGKGNTIAEPVIINGFRLVGFGAVQLNKGKDMYDNMGDFNEHARCGRNKPDKEPLNSGAGGMDGYADGIVLQLSSKNVTNH